MPSHAKRSLSSRYPLGLHQRFSYFFISRTSKSCIYFLQTPEYCKQRIKNRLPTHEQNAQVFVFYSCCCLQNWFIQGYVRFMLLTTFSYSRGSQTYSGQVPLQHFDRWACTPKISHNIKAEENNKNIFTKHIIINNNIHHGRPQWGGKTSIYPLGNVD